MLLHGWRVRLKTLFEAKKNQKHTRPKKSLSGGGSDTQRISRQAVDWPSHWHQEPLTKLLDFSFYWNKFTSGDARIRSVTQHLLKEKLGPSHVGR